MSYAQGLSVVEDLLQMYVEDGRVVDKSSVEEALLEDFTESELLSVCAFWLSDYGCKPEWRQAVLDLISHLS